MSGTCEACPTTSDTKVPSACEAAAIGSFETARVPGRLLQSTKEAALAGLIARTRLRGPERRLLPLTAPMREWAGNRSNRERDRMTYQPIENYGIIGNLHSAALVGMNGSIDFLCGPGFDGPSIFAALLDDEKGGRFQIAPVLEGAKARQLYLPNTNVLVTRFLSETGVAEITDFMPVDDAGFFRAVVRRVKTVRGEIRFRAVCDPRPGYARVPVKVEREHDSILFRVEGYDQATGRLHATIPLDVYDGTATAEFVLGAGETAEFILAGRLAGEESPSDLAHWSEQAFAATVAFWRSWIRRSKYRGRWAEEAVNRSALALKLLVSKEHGSIVAAPTFGLPEEIGGERNWDYRYTWIRDSSFTLYALLRLGFGEEAEGFMRWIEARCGELNPDGSLQIMYGIDGRRELSEETLDHLEGYCNSRPVRVGNAAYDQLQLDIYGELMDSVYLYDKWVEPINYDLWSNLCRLIDWVCGNWRSPDEGIWEVRGGRQEFLYSRLMCWVALDRAVRLAWNGSRDAPIDHWVRVRNEIHREIFTEFWDAEGKVFVQRKASKTLDASALLMPLVRIIGPRDPRWLSTLAAVERDLVDDTLVYRYRVAEAAADGLSGSEGTFNMCSFWFIENLSRAGQLDKARLNFEKMLGYGNHLRLYSEELGPSGEHLGNFPQAFTHLALISAAFDLNRRLDAAHGA